MGFNNQCSSKNFNMIMNTGDLFTVKVLFKMYTRGSC